MNAPRAILVVAGDHDWADVTALRLVALGCRVRHAVSLPQALAVGTHDSCSVLLIDQCSYADDAAELTAQLAGDLDQVVERPGGLFKECRGKSALI